LCGARTASIDRLTRAGKGTEKIYLSMMAINALANAKIRFIRGCRKMIGFARTEKGEKMDDMISRQAALAAIDKNRQDLLSLGMDGAEHILVHYGRRAIEEVPPIEPKKGKWIKRKDAMGKDIYICSNCETEVLWRDVRGVLLRVDMQNANYCPNCGAKMDDDWEEPEINPCRGCDDYDGRGGCKSHGGCGAERSEE
jgi:DNA-directed RNA polymerase subunit RPC12/RpoP